MGQRFAKDHRSIPDAILIVDDAASNLVAYRALLEPLGHEIVTARSGDEALRLSDHRQFAVLLIDVRMQDIDGFRTVEMLRGQLRRVTPVIFVTGERDDEAMRRAYEFGAVDFLVKPVDPKILRGKVHNLLALYEQGVELDSRAARLVEQDHKLGDADALLKKQDTSIGILAHDLRNPLNAIVTSANWLATMPDLPEPAKRAAARINRSAERMTTMIRDILDFARGRLVGGILLKRQPTDLAVLSNAVVEEILAGHPTARIEVESVGKLTGQWDPARIEQALSNLVANAIQHGKGDVRLTASAEHDHVVVTVRNEGNPIPADQLATVFEPFTKRPENPGGLGLGLFIVREIAEAHEGTVTVTSGADCTSFSLRLPRRPPARASRTNSGQRRSRSTTRASD